MHFKRGIEQCPLQAYTSALMFSPSRGLIRSLFKRDEPQITIMPSIQGNWNACLQTLEGHSHWVSSVAFSPDGARLASGSGDQKVKIWDANSGECLQTLEGHSDSVSSVAFSPDGARPASTYYGWAVSSDGEWITYNSENWVWIPSEYRPSCSAVSRETIGIGVGNGKVWMSNFKVDKV